MRMQYVKNKIQLKMSSQANECIEQLKTLDTLLLTTHKAGIFENFFFLLLFTSEIGKCVDDDTKDEIENDNDDDEEEQQIIDNTCNKQRLLKNKQYKLVIHLKIL